MIPLPRRLVCSLAAFAASASLLCAHPGHDGHELTWDFSHLAAYPLATAGWAALLGAAVAIGWRLARRSRGADHSLRGSQRSLGK